MRKGFTRGNSFPLVPRKRFPSSVSICLLCIFVFIFMFFQGVIGGLVFPYCSVMPEILNQASTSFVIPEIFYRESIFLNTVDPGLKIAGVTTFLRHSRNLQSGIHVFKYCRPRLKDCRGDDFSPSFPKFFIGNPRFCFFFLSFYWER